MIMASEGYMIDVIHMNWGSRSKKEAEELKEKVKKVLEERGFKVAEARVEQVLRGYWTPAFDVVVMTVEKWNEIYPKGYDVAEKFHKELKEVLEEEVKA